MRNVVLTVLICLGFAARMQAQAPSVTSLSPTEGPVGTTVTISGSGFGSTQGSSTVKFGGSTATVTSWSKPTIVVTVPDIGVDVSTNVNVIVTVGGLSSPAVVFKVTTSSSMPNISNLSQNTGPVGTAVTITGTNFGSTQGTSTVTFNGVAGAPTSWTATSIAVPVPSGASTGSLVVTVAGQASNEVLFTVAPHINSMMPTASIAGATVSISGTTFGATQGTSTVTFNGATATPANWTASLITVTVPAAATSGNVVVTAGGVASNGVAFTVAPLISSLSPASGGVGTGVTITGSGFGPAQGTSTVTFNGVNATPTSWSATSITVPVPNGASSGNVVVTVVGMPSNGVAFTVAPHINSMMPTSSVTGATVSISGTNFGATQGTSTVTFNGAAATPTNWSASSITVTVPAAATSGNVVVTVGGVSSNGVNFTVVPSGPQVTGVSPAFGTPGTPVTITGSGFGATQGTSTVTFGGVPATPSSWSNTQIVAPAPNGANTGNVVVTVGGVSTGGTPFAIPVSPNIAISCVPACGGAPQPYGTAVTFTTTVSNPGPGARPVPTGTVDFDDGGVNGTVLCSPPLSGGVASCPQSQLKAGTHAIQVAYLNDPPSAPIYFNTLSTQTAIWTVSAASTSTALTSDINPSKVQQRVTFTATIAGVANGDLPTGNVVFKDTFNGSTTTLSTNSVGANGQPHQVAASFSTATLDAGSHSITAVYSGDTNYATSTSNAVAQTVNVAPVISGLGPPSGPIGMGFTITGSNFGATAGTVTMGGTTMVQAQWTDTSITVQVPPGMANGSRAVVVTSAPPAGQTTGQSSLPVNFNVRDRFIPNCAP